MRDSILGLAMPFVVVIPDGLLISSLILALQLRFAIIVFDWCIGDIYVSLFS